MRFIVMHKVDAKMEAGGPPDQDIVRKMGELIGETAKTGAFLDGAGLHASARRVRLPPAFLPNRLTSFSAVCRS